MKKLLSTKHVVSSLIIVFCTMFKTAFAQSGPPIYYGGECLNDATIVPAGNQTLSTLNSEYGWALPTSGTFRILVIFAEIDYTGSGYTDPTTSTDPWQPGQLPPWANQLFDANSSSNYTGLFTKYFQTMSLGNMTVLGDYLVNPANASAPVKVSLTDILNGNNINSPDDDVINAANSFSSFQTHSNLAVADFNNISGIGSWGQQKTFSANSPNRYDHVMILIRNYHFWGDGSGHSNGGPMSTNLQGYGIQSYSAFTARMGVPLGIMKHEFSHLMVGSNNFHFAGGSTGDADGTFIHPQGGWGLLGNAFSSFITCNAWDRYWLGWKASGNNYIISARSNGNTAELDADLDATNSTQAGLYLLRDFVTTGDALRIKLPFIPGTEYQQWLWVENHITDEFGGSEFDKFQFKGASCVDNASPGLYFYTQIGRDNKVGSDIYGWDPSDAGRPDFLRFLPGNGFYDMVYDNTEVSETCVSWTTYYPFSKIAGYENALTGNAETDRVLKIRDFPYHATLARSSRYVNMIENVNNSYIQKAYNYGTATHALQQAKVGIATNPSSNSINSLVIQDDAPLSDFSSLNNRKIYISGVSVEIVQQYSNGDILVEVKFDDIDVNQDVRWCAEDIVLSPINSPSGYSLNITPGHTLTLDRGRSHTRVTNSETFDGGTYFNSKTKFSVQPDAVLHIEEGAAMVVKNGSELHIENNGSIIVENNATLTIQDDSKFILESGGHLIVKDGGRVIIADNGGFVFKGGEVKLDGTDAIIEVQGYVEPVGSAAFSITSTTAGAHGYLRFINNDVEHRTIRGAGPFRVVDNINYPKSILVAGSAGINPDPGLSLFEVNNANVELESNAAIYAECPVKFVVSTFTSFTSAKFEAIYILGGQNHIESTTITNGEFGLYWLSLNKTNKLDLTYSTINNCNIGVYTYGNSADLSSVIFKNNNTGWQADAMETSSRLDYCQIFNNGSGVTYEGTPGAGILNAKRTFVYLNNSGVSINYTGFAPGCGEIKNNTTSGVSLHKRAAFHIDPTLNKFTGYMNISNNEKAIVGVLCGNLYLNNSNSNLASLNPDYALYGLAHNYVGNLLPAKNNYWDIYGNPPTYSTNYAFALANQTAVSIPQVSYLSVPPAASATCYNNIWGSGGASGSGILDYHFLSLAQSISISSANFNNTNLADAVYDILDTLYLDSTGGNRTAINWCKEVITYNYGYDFIQAFPTLIFLYDKMMEAYGKGVFESQILPEKNGSTIDTYMQTLFDVQEFLLDSIGNDSQYLAERTKINLDKALLLRIAGKRGDAINLLDDMLGWVNENDETDVEEWKCKISTEIDVLNGIVNPTSMFGFAAACTQGSSSERKGRNDNFFEVSNNALLKNQNGNYLPYHSTFDYTVLNDARIKMYPNPANDNLFFIADEYRGIIDVRIIDLSGKQIKYCIINSNSGKIDIGILSNGVYFVKINTPHGVKVEKLVVSR
ncbi:MAG: T9SS type A sorting domain-containing protein [Bacteroidia bacterium]|nr:T9SS type A sorting domain-containing protein [Bacteroidia bacterium]